MSTLVADFGKDEIVCDPPIYRLASPLSQHVFAFSTQHDMLFVQSEGEFDFVTFEAVEQAAQARCCDSSRNETSRDIAMLDEKSVTVEKLLRMTIEEEIIRSETWKQSGK